MKFLLILTLLFLASCSKPTGEVARILESEGCSQVVDGGANWIFTGCSDSDFYNNQFYCVKNSMPIRGVVCSGFFKGYTIRYY